MTFRTDLSDRLVHLKQHLALSHCFFELHARGYVSPEAPLDHVSESWPHSLKELPAALVARYWKLWLAATTEERQSQREHLIQTRDGIIALISQHGPGSVILGESNLSQLEEPDREDH